MQGNVSLHSNDVKEKDREREELARLMASYDSSSKLSKKPIPDDLTVKENAIIELSTIEISGIAISRSAFEVAKLMRRKHRHKRHFKGITEEEVNSLAMKLGLNLRK